MESAIFEGKLRHRRFAAPSRSFSYSLYMVYLDLGELETIFAGRWLWSTGAPNVAWFRRDDHYGDPKLPLDSSIRDLVAARTGTRPSGPIRLLTHLRYLGHCFNPVSFYYCFAADGRTVETVVAEVSNTPWKERHMYVLPWRGDEGDFDFKKAFHVSPFLDMEMDYHWRFGAPPVHEGNLLWVRMENLKQGACVFNATLTLQRRTITGPELARALVRRPAMTVAVVAAIYWQALRLWVRRAPFYAHPRIEPSRQS